MPSAPAGIDQHDLSVGPPARGHAFPIVGGLLVAGALVIAVLATGILAFANSVCNADPVVLQARRHVLRQQGCVLWVVASLAPALCGLVSGKTRRRVWPWATAAGAFLLVACYEAIAAEPTSFCLF